MQSGLPKRPLLGVLGLWANVVCPPISGLKLDVILPQVRAL